MRLDEERRAVRRRRVNWAMGTATIVAVLAWIPIVSTTAGAAELCARRVPDYDSVYAEWSWIPPGVRCVVDVDSERRYAFVLPWDEPPGR
jgi:hypothetical protein